MERDSETAAEPERAVTEQAVTEQAATGDDRVDEALAELADLGGRPVDEHPAVFERVHRGLTEALGALDSSAEDLSGASGTRGPSGTAITPRT
jgi:hypothetical protein